MTKTLTRNEVSELSELGKSASFRYETRRVLVEGSRAVSGARLAGAKFDYLIVSDENQIEEEYESITYLVDEKAIGKISTTPNPQNVLGICKLPETGLSDFSKTPLNKKSVFVLDHISDPGNLGTIFRSAVAFGVGGVVTIGGCDPFHPKVVRSSAGSLFACPVVSLEEFQLGELTKSRTVYCADSNGHAKLEDTKFEENSCIVFGNEANGIITEFFLKNTTSFTISMQELCESLNVAMTATIVAHHLSSKNRKM